MTMVYMIHCSTQTMSDRLHVQNNTESDHLCLKMQQTIATKPQPHLPQGKMEIKCCISSNTTIVNRIIDFSLTKRIIATYIYILSIIVFVNCVKRTVYDVVF